MLPFSFTMKMKTARAVMPRGHSFVADEVDEILEIGG